MASLLKKDYETKQCVFSIISPDELEKLPTTKRYGKEELINTPCCIIGSIAACKDGTTYILSDNDEWIEYSVNVGVLNLENIIRPITNEEIDEQYNE